MHFLVVNYRLSSKFLLSVTRSRQNISNLCEISEKKASKRRCCSRIRNYKCQKRSMSGSFRLCLLCIRYTNIWVGKISHFRALLADVIGQFFTGFKSTSIDPTRTDFNKKKKNCLHDFFPHPSNWEFKSSQRPSVQF